MTYKERHAATVKKARSYIKYQVTKPGTSIYALWPPFVGSPGDSAKESIEKIIDAMPSDKVIELADGFSSTVVSHPDPWKNTIIKIINEAFLKMDHYVRYYGFVNLTKPAPGKGDFPGETGPLTAPTYTLPCLDPVKLKARELLLRSGVIHIVGHIVSDHSEKPVRLTHPITDLSDEDFCELVDYLLGSIAAKVG